MGVGQVLNIAYTGIAAAECDGQTFSHTFKYSVGNTESSIYKFTVYQRMSAEEILEFKERTNMDLLSTVVFDEISMCIPEYLSYMDFVLRQARGIDYPFGNLAIFITGDFNQLPPVLGDSLYKSAIQCAEYNLNNTRVIDGKFLSGDKFQLGNPHQHGVELFSKAHTVFLTDKKRSTDKQHTEVIEKMSNGGILSRDDLKLYKSLSREDFENDPSWHKACTVLASNHERVKIGTYQAYNYAKMKGEHIVRFPLDIKSWKNKPDLNKHPHVKDDQALWGFFVRTAPGNLAANINPPIKLANGTLVEYHSIYWEDEELNDLYRELEKSTPPGELITMPEEPTAINVIVNPSDSKIREACFFGER